MAEESLNSIMEFDHVIRVTGTGQIVDGDIDFYGEVSMELVDADAERWELREELPKGWVLLKNFSGQYSYSGPVFHPSEFIGGGLERHIRETPGYYVALTVESDCAGAEDRCNEEDGCQCEPDGWAVAYKPSTAQTGADRAAAALAAYYDAVNGEHHGTYGDEGGDTFREYFQDLLSDLRHLADRSGVDFTDILFSASERYIEEKES